MRQTYLIPAMLLIALFPCLIARAEIGDLEASADVGKVEHPGSATFDKAKRQYRVTGSGENMWKGTDAFHFAYRKHSGDATLATDIELLGVSNGPHRKAGLMVRQTLDADSPYVDAVIHGDGSIALQFRKVKGGDTDGIKCTLTAPASLRLERRGDTFTLYVKGKDAPEQTAGSVKLAMPDPVFVGLVVCSHDAAKSETAIFSNVSLPTKEK